MIRGGKKPSSGFLNRFRSSRCVPSRCADSFVIVKGFSGRLQSYAFRVQPRCEGRGVQENSLNRYRGGDSLGIPRLRAHDPLGRRVYRGASLGMTGPIGYGVSRVNSKSNFTIARTARIVSKLRVGHHPCVHLPVSTILAMRLRAHPVRGKGLSHLNSL